MTGLRKSQSGAFCAGQDNQLRVDVSPNTTVIDSCPHVVFDRAASIYEVPTGGGRARRLITHGTFPSWSR